MIELITPIRAEYDSDEDYIYACALAAREYSRKIDALASRMSANNNYIHREKPRRAPDASLADFLADRPNLAEKVRKYGLKALLE